MTKRSASAVGRGPKAPPRLRIGISACLLGRPVRYDGTHRRQAWTETLGRLVEWVPVCPEVELGLGTPREPIQLVGSPSRPRLVGVAGGEDHTSRMKAYARAKLRELARLDLCGFVFKDRSPSCGPEGVPVLTAQGVATWGTGLFARAVLARFPGLPVAGEERLRDPEAREAFLRRARAYAASRRGGRPRAPVAERSARARR